MVQAISNRGRVVVAKVGLDGHDRGARVLSAILSEQGFEVVFVGVRHTPAQVAAIAQEQNADVVGISLLSGAHVELCRAVRQALDAKGMAHVPIAAGGTIPRHDAAALREAGVEFAFHPGDDTSPERLGSLMDRLVEKSRDQ